MEKINVIYKEPLKDPEVRKIDNELDVFQQLVQGFIETVPVLPGVVAIVNDFGKLNGQKYNFWINGDCIFGPAVFVGVDGEDFASVPPQVLGLIYAWLEGARHGGI